MIPITHVKLSHGPIIDIRTVPVHGDHYEIHHGILWAVPAHQKSNADYLRMMSMGRIIARGINETEVDITMPQDFQLYRVWCQERNFKPYDQESLNIYIQSTRYINQMRILNLK
jgi:hypothetical protein